MPTASSDAPLVSLPALAEGAAYSTAVAAAIVLALALIVVTQFRRPGRAPKPEAPPPTGQSAETPRRRQTADPALRRLADLAARFRRHRFHASPGLNFLGWFAVLLAPVWAVLLIATMLGLARLWGSFFFPSAPMDNTGLRWLTLATVGLMTALAGLVGTPLALIRVFTTERQTRTAEENLTTELINKAVAALGTEKTVKERGQERTVPNIEVRVGALYQLERLAFASAHSGRPEGTADHLRIMKILCAYVRENAPATKAVDLNMPDWPDYPENASAEELKARAATLKARGEDLTDKIAKIRAKHKPRTDIQTALEVIGRRDDRQTKIERAAKGPGQQRGYRLDLRATNLQAADLSHLNFDRALLREARMEGADLRWARMEGANLGRARMEGARLVVARMEGANLSWARMEGADLFAARMEGADLVRARMEGANLSWARMEGADLFAARMEGADLVRARMEGANLFAARMEGADLVRARMEGANLFAARMRNANWAGVSNRVSPAQFADLRGGRSLDQARLSSLVGNAATLLPETPDGEPDLFVPHKWAEAPPGFETLLANLMRRGESQEQVRAAFLCAPGEVPLMTGTPWPADAPPPWGAQGADESDEDYRERIEAWAAAQPDRGPVPPEASG